MSDTWFVDVPLDVAMQRVTARQISGGKSKEVALARVAGNDRPNGEAVVGSRGLARILVPSDVPFRGDSNGGGGGGGAGQ